MKNIVFSYKRLRRLSNSCITLRYTAPVECLFWRWDRMPNIGKQLVQVISDRSLDEHPIFFHVFSNGGAFLYQHVSLAMQQAGTPIKVGYDYLMFIPT